MSRMLIISAIIITIVVVGALYYFYYTSSNQAGAILEIDYQVINDPQTISSARKLIESLQIPHTSDQQGQEIDWNNTDIAVLEITVELINKGKDTIYYITNSYCGASYYVKEPSTITKPFNWTVRKPISLPEIDSEKGQVLPIAIGCTEDLRYEKMLPGTSISQKFYYILSKPFKGTIRVMTEICTEPLSNKCDILEKSIIVEIN
ncbi:MAG: hypothetical protein J7L82_00035 [Staphylothermus sp.]|nr:hypothetical protein [Staphylothermus sp.]